MCYTRNKSELCLFNGARHHTIIIGGKVSAGVGILNMSAVSAYVGGVGKFIQLDLVDRVP